jgi:zinc protease
MMMRFIGAVFAAVIALPVAAETEIQEVVSPGGITAWLVEEHSIPFTSIEIRFQGGASLDEPGKRGATNLMVGLLEEGTGDMDAQAFAEAREALAATYIFGAYDDSLTIGTKFLSENANEAVALLKQAVVSPRFDEVALERVRAQVIAGIKSDAQDPDTIARFRFNGAAFGDHPYGTDSSGTIESVEALTQEDLFTAHRNVLARDRLYVAAVGDITPAELGAMLDDLLGDLPATGAPMPEPVEFALDGGVTVVDFKTPQSTALFGHSGIAQEDDDFFAAYVLNTVLGGAGFESRLMNEVRKKRGLTYGVGSYLLAKDYSATVLGSVRSSNDRIAEAIEVITAEWGRMATTGVTPEELTNAKLLLTGAYPLRFDGNTQIAMIMVGMQMQGLPIDYIATRNERVDAVTLEDVNRVAAELLRAEDLHFMVVGEPEGLTSTN